MSNIYYANSNSAKIYNARSSKNESLWDLNLSECTAVNIQDSGIIICVLIAT